jgi:hypothetical protein
VISPFCPQHAHVDPEKLPALPEKKNESRPRPRISFYRWLGQHHDEEEKRVTFKPDTKEEKETPKEVKEGLGTIVDGLLEPTISLNETKEYERYIFRAH